MQPRWDLLLSLNMLCEVAGVTEYVDWLVSLGSRIVERIAIYEEI